MRSKKLLMVTTAYPYGQGEAFVKVELEDLSRHFADMELVPSFYTPDVGPRPISQQVNLVYAATRWGPGRKFHVLRSFGVACCKYKWLEDARRILGQGHKYENIKELARSLYRAQLFESFLKSEILDNKKEVNLIYFYWMIPEIAGAIRFRETYKVPLKIVARAHGGDLYEEQRHGGYAGLRGTVVTGLDHIFCISDNGREYLENRYKSTKPKASTARLGVDDPGYLNPQPRNHDLSIVSCSFVVTGKRLHLIVDAIAYLLEKDPSLKIKWTHIGDGKLYDQVHDYSHQRLAGRAEVVFKGYLTQDQVMGLYRVEGFDVIVNVSDSEGIPVSLMEASSTGIPMVATDVGGNSEIVNSGNGVLIPADADIQTIASALIYFKDRNLASDYRVKARAWWAEKFNARKNYDKFARDLLEALEPVSIDADTLQPSRAPVA
jgi:colanic acid/amylovoran biosynthesis glycosyltransferase